MSAWMGSAPQPRARRQERSHIAACAGVGLVPSGLAVGTTFLRNIDQPTLSVFTPRTGRANGVGVIVVPGGGWTINAWDHEGLAVARWLAGAGYTAFLLKYRVQKSPPDIALCEAQGGAEDLCNTIQQLRQGDPGVDHVVGVRRLGQAAQDVAAALGLGGDQFGILAHRSGRRLPRHFLGHDGDGGQGRAQFVRRRGR